MSCGEGVVWLRVGETWLREMWRSLAERSRVGERRDMAMLEAQGESVAAAGTTTVAMTGVVLNRAGEALAITNAGSVVCGECARRVGVHGTGLVSRRYEYAPRSRPGLTLNSLFFFIGSSSSLFQHEPWRDSLPSLC